MTADIEKEPPQPTKDDAPEKKLDIFDIVGGDGLWQRCIFLLVLFFSIPAGTHNLVMSFFAPNMDYWCARPEGSNWTVDEWKSIGLPEDDKQCSRSVVHKCLLINSTSGESRIRVWGGG
ncbi:hypothetical protein AVEN_166465-1 [Araneus ventricosus]|uniref:Uncharacterized protein n=1 Tax=Araneus ventricosus TaxID=182803 RepID=A0A4Y2KX95_ARAVE|nr:hypothetical protein AVEN_166465-1 [Araneus ventricosus]